MGLCSLYFIVVVVLILSGLAVVLGCLLTVLYLLCYYVLHGLDLLVCIRYFFCLFVSLLCLFGDTWLISFLWIYFWFTSCCFCVWMLFWWLFCCMLLFVLCPGYFVDLVFGYECLLVVDVDCVVLLLCFLLWFGVLTDLFGLVFLLIFLFGDLVVDVAGILCLCCLLCLLIWVRVYCLLFYYVVVFVCLDLCLLFMTITWIV